MCEGEGLEGARGAVRHAAHETLAQAQHRCPPLARPSNRPTPPNSPTRPPAEHAIPAPTFCSSFSSEPLNPSTFWLSRSSVQPPPVTMPSSTAALVAFSASSTRSFFSFSSVSVWAPTCRVCVCVCVCVGACVGARVCVCVNVRARASPPTPSTPTHPPGSPPRPR